MCSFKPPGIIQETSLSWFMHQNVNENSLFSPRYSKAEAFIALQSFFFFSGCRRNQGASQSAEEAAIAGGLQIPF